MRTAITLKQLHSGEWELLHGPDVSLVQQQQEFRRAKVRKSDPEIRTLRLQESDGHAFSYTFMTPEQEKAREAQRQKDSDALKNRAAQEAAAAARGAEQRQAAIAQAHADALEDKAAALAKDPQAEKAKIEEARKNRGKVGRDVPVAPPKTN